MVHAVLALSPLLWALGELTPPIPCVTIAAGYHAAPPEVIEAHLDVYEAMGVEMLRVETSGEWERFVVHVRGRPFRMKLILYVLGIPPDYAEAHPHEAMTDSSGVLDWHFGPWHPQQEEIVLASARAQMDRARELGILDQVDEIVADLGPAGEGIYPANWTLGREGEEPFWCYGEAAQADFRRAMARRYETIAAANAAWGLSGEQTFERWDDLVIPAPGTEWARGAFWRDMLEWYRDCKRDFMSRRIDQTLAIAREYLGPGAKVVVYLPGYAYSEAEWEDAVRTASGSASVRLMMDNDWLMAQALERGCILQYTGSENAGEVARIVRKLRQLGYVDPTLLWAENAGVEAAGQNPQWLADVVTHYGLRGLDYTWDSWLWEADGLTVSQTYPAFVAAVDHLKGAGPGPQGTPLHLRSRPEVRRVALGAYELSAGADTRLLSLFPDTVKGFDSELAAVGGDQKQVALLRFPIEDLPTGLPLRSATLVLKGIGSYGDQAALPVEVRPVTSAWEEPEASWLARSTYEDWDSPGGDAGPAMAVAEVAGTDPATTWTWDVTWVVRQWQSGQLPNHGLLLGLPEGSRGIKSFASREHPDPSMRPVLRVERAW